MDFIETTCICALNLKLKIVGPSSLKQPTFWWTILQVISNYENMKQSFFIISAWAWIVSINFWRWSDLILYHIGTIPFIIPFFKFYLEYSLSYLLYKAGRFSTSSIIEYRITCFLYLDYKQWLMNSLGLNETDRLAGTSNYLIASEPWHVWTWMIHFHRQQLNHPQNRTFWIFLVARM